MRLKDKTIMFGNHAGPALLTMACLLWQQHLCMVSLMAWPTAAEARCSASLQWGSCSRSASCARVGSAVREPPAAASRDCSSACAWPPCTSSATLSVLFWLGAHVAPVFCRLTSVQQTVALRRAKVLVA